MRFRVFRPGGDRQAPTGCGAAATGVGQEPIVAAATDPAGTGRRAAGPRPPLPTQQPS